MAGIPDMRSVMTSFPFTIDAGASVVAAQEMMERHGIRHLPVTQDNVLVGIVTDRDIRHFLDPIVNYPLHGQVRDIMVTDPYVVDPDEPLDAVLLTLAERRIGSALVAENGKLTGIFTTTDAALMLTATSLAAFVRRGGDDLMHKVNLAEKFRMIREHWSPHIVGELNGQHVKLARLEGEFVWHRHGDEDELFLVLDGALAIELRDRTVELTPGELFIVPRGVEHRPVARGEVQVLLFEPAGTLNTGNVRNERTVEKPARL